MPSTGVPIHPEQQPAIEMTFDGAVTKRSDVALGAFAAHLVDLNKALGATDRLLHGKRSVDFRVVNLSHNSPATVSVAAYPKRGFVAHQDVLDQFVSLLVEIDQTGSASSWADDSVLKHLGSIANRTTGKQNTARLGFGDATLVFDQAFKSKIDSILAPETRYKGSAKGMMEAINLHGSPEFKIYPEVGPAFLVCHIPEDMEDDMLAAIRQLVVVHGTLICKERSKFATEIIVDEIEIVKDPVPSLLSVHGILPVSGAGASSESEIRELRDNWDAL